MDAETNVWKCVRKSLIKARRHMPAKTRRLYVVVALATMIMVTWEITRHRNEAPNLDSGYYVNQQTNRETPGVKRGNGRLYVGVMTTGGFLNTRAKAVFETWGSNPFVSKIDFFARKSQTDTNRYNFSIITLRDVDDMAYPPQKKSFRMLQYICETQLDKFEWYLRADDDLYVKVQEFIAHVVLPSNSKIGYLGHPGRGRDHDSDAHKLLGSDTYCMGGPGILFSNWALKKICPHLEKCRTSVLIKNEDVEVGRCAMKQLGPGCKTPKEMMYRFFHVSNAMLPSLLSGNYSNFRPFKRALTLHPLKNPDDMYRLHRYYVSSRSKVKAIATRSKVKTKHIQSKKNKLRINLIPNTKKTHTMNNAHKKSYVMKANVMPKISGIKTSYSGSKRLIDNNIKVMSKNSTIKRPRQKPPKHTNGVRNIKTIKKHKTKKVVKLSGRKTNKKGKNMQNMKNNKLKNIITQKKQ